jgi:hypothetical protein
MRLLLLDTFVHNRSAHPFLQRSEAFSTTEVGDSLELQQRFNLSLGFVFYIVALLHVNYKKLISILLPLELKNTTYQQSTREKLKAKPVRSHEFRGMNDTVAYEFPVIDPKVPVFLNVEGARKSIQWNRFGQSMKPEPEF